MKASHVFLLAKQISTFFENENVKRKKDLMQEVFNTRRDKEKKQTKKKKLRGHYSPMDVPLALESFCSYSLKFMFSLFFFPSFVPLKVS